MATFREIFYIIVSCCNIIFGSIFILLFLYFLINLKNFKFIRLKGLRAFIYTCCFPAAILITLFSILIGFYYLTTKNTESNEFKHFRIIITFGSYQLRFSLLTVIVDRVAATVYLEKYSKFSSSKIIWIFMGLISYVINLSFQIVTSLSIFANDSISYNFNVYFVPFVHVITLITCKLLHSKNQKLYKMLVYNISLKQRYQILENIKVLKILWPPILIFSVCGFVGPLLSFLHTQFVGYSSPAGTNHVTYNISFIIIIIRTLKSKVQKSKIVSITGNQFILSPLGNNLPANISNDMYFKELKQQWN